MSKTRSITPSASLEITTPGEPSATMLVKLKAAGAQITDAQISQAFARAEKSRTSFVTDAIIAGSLLLAKKLTMKHGQWLPWKQKFATSLLPKSETRFASDAASTSRTFERYCYLAKHFLADLEQGHFAGEGADEQVAIPDVKPSDVLAIEALPEQQRSAVVGRIEQFVAGRSLRRVLCDFRRAEDAADRDDAGHPKGKVSPATSPDAGQLDFWDDFAAPLTAIDTLFSSEDFVGQTDKAFWKRAADALEAQVKFARAKAKEIAK